MILCFRMKYKNGNGNCQLSEIQVYFQRPLIGPPIIRAAQIKSAQIRADKVVLIYELTGSYFWITGVIIDSLLSSVVGYLLHEFARVQRTYVQIRCSFFALVDFFPELGLAKSVKSNHRKLILKFSRALLDGRRPSLGLVWLPLVFPVPLSPLSFCDKMKGKYAFEQIHAVT